MVLCLIMPLSNYEYLLQSTRYFSKTSRNSECSGVSRNIEFPGFNTSSYLDLFDLLLVFLFMQSLQN